MKKIFFAISAAAVILSSCSVRDEWSPVFTGNSNPDAYPQMIMNRTITIRDLCAKYQQGTPWLMTGNHVIEGKVISSDETGNFYKSFYIQDETAGIEIKIGKNGLYNDYKEGQTIYVKCNDLYLGMYGYKSGTGQGMVQIGHKDPLYDTDPDNGYETSYIEAPLLIDTHVIRGEMGPAVQPVVVEESALPTSAQHQKHNSNVGRLVTIKNLEYGWYDKSYDEQNEAFLLLYLDSSQNKKLSSNRIFISGSNTHLTSWAVSKAKMTSLLMSGIWDDVKIGNANDQNYGTVGDHKVVDEKTGAVSYPTIEKAAGSVSQYFHAPGGTCVQIRTSGFSRFGDREIPSDILSGQRKINVTGVLCVYQGKVQMTVNRLEDITYDDGTPLYL